MSLSPETCLRGVLHTLQDRVLPALDDSFAAESARLAGLLLAITANGVDSAAAIRVEENAQMRSLFADAAVLAGAAELRDQLAAAAASRDPGLRISQLDAENDRLRAVLVALHADAELQPGETARGLCVRIWQMLRAFEAARAPQR